MLAALYSLSILCTKQLAKNSRLSEFIRTLPALREVKRGNRSEMRRYFASTRMTRFKSEILGGEGENGNKGTGEQRNGKQGKNRKKGDREKGTVNRGNREQGKQGKRE